MIPQHINNMPLIATCEKCDAINFLTQFGKPNIPFLLQQGMKDTPAMQKWDWRFLRDNYGKRPLIVYRSGNRNEYRRVLFQEYLDYIHTTQDENPFYLLDWFLDKNCPELRADYDVPTYFRSWTDVLPKSLRPKFLAFYIGPKNSSSPLHIDILSTSAWNAVFRGKKLWVFYPPDQADRVYRGKVNPFQPDYEQYPLFKHAQGLYAIQNAGDLLFTPSNWWHAVINLENVISLTDNFINGSNIQLFFNYFFPSISYLAKRTWHRRHQRYNR